MEEKCDRLIEYLSYMPSDIIDYCIKPRLPPEALVWLNRENYVKYHSVVRSMIPDDNYESYIRDMVRKDCSFVFAQLLEENFGRWKKNKKYRYKSYVFDNYLCFLGHYSIENNSTKCRELLNSKGDAVLGQKWHKNVRIRNTRWSN